MNKNPNIRFIVARYNEDLSWLNSVLGSCCIINKGSTLTPEMEKAAEVIQRENLGRESDSYLHYIIQHYNDLPDVCVFTQGNILDHIRDKSDPVRYLKILCDEASEFGMSRTRAMCSNVYDKDWGPAWNVRGHGYYLENNYRDDNHMIFHTWFIRNICPRYPRLLKIHMNGIFAVRKDRILRNPIHEYIRLNSLVNWHNDPIEGHFLERSWFYIFDACSFQHNASACLSPSVLRKALSDKGIDQSGRLHS